MHLGWSADIRPGWRFRCEYELLEPRGEAVPLLRLRLQAALDSTGRVRSPRAHVPDRRLTVVMAVKADDEVQASATGLGVVDVAVGRLGGVVLGALHSYGATRLGPWS